MPKGFNKTFLLGNVGRAPEIRASNSGSVIANLSLATADRVKENGEWKDRTEWHNLVAFGRTAEIIRDYVHKGTQLFVEGKLQTRSWEKDGAKQYRTEIIVNELSLLGGTDSQERNDVQPSGSSRQNFNEEITDEDIPF